jgi:molybdate transport system substrate-binding protein
VSVGTARYRSPGRCRFRFHTLLILAVVLGCSRAAPTAEVTIAAAASLRAVMPKLAQAFEASHPGTHVVATFGASGDVKKQVEGGAPIDAVVLAAARPVDELAARGRVDPASRRAVATNTLVLIGPRGGPALTFANLDALPAGEHVAIGDPGAVPAGDYARTYLTALGKWDALRGRLVLGGDVGAVLAYARRGEVAAAIVYRTEVRGVPDVVVLDEAEGPAAPRPEVVAAIVRGARGAELAAEFLGFVTSPEGRRILSDFGFGAP